MAPTVIPLAITSVFASIFVYSAVHEFMRRRREGPSDNPRAGFHFDEDAPSYVRPPEAETDDGRPADSAESGDAAAAPDEQTDAAPEQAPNHAESETRQ